MKYSYLCLQQKTYYMYVSTAIYLKGIFYSYFFNLPVFLSKNICMKVPQTQKLVFLFFFQIFKLIKLKYHCFRFMERILLQIRLVPPPLTVRVRGRVTRRLGPPPPLQHLLFREAAVAVPTPSILMGVRRIPIYPLQMLRIMAIMATKIIIINIWLNGTHIYIKVIFDNTFFDLPHKKAMWW